MDARQASEKVRGPVVAKTMPNFLHRCKLCIYEEADDCVPGRFGYRRDFLILCESMRAEDSFDDGSSENGRERFGQHDI